LSAIINDRLYRLCEQHGLLEHSQEGFRKLRCTQRQVQSLHWVVEEAAQRGSPLYLAYLDFANAFNSVDHEAVWRWLTELNIPDVDLLQSLYEGAHYEADLPYGRSASVYLTRGTKQGDILSPLLFNLIFNALLIGLRRSGVGHRTVSGQQTTSRGFADDLVLSTTTAGGMQKLLQVVSSFCSWSGMRVKLQKSVITAFDFGRWRSLPTDEILFNGASLVCLSPDESFRYLGIRTALIRNRKARKGACPCTEDEVEHVLRCTKELKQLLAEHQMPLSSMVPAMRMVAASRFRYSAALVPWTDAALEDLFKIWMQVERATWKLPGSFPSAQFRLPTVAGGSPLEHPRVVLIQALSTHVRQLVAFPDSLRESTIRSYRRLCSSCGCLNERELAPYLAAEKKPRACPIARLLRACGQLQMDIKLPDCLSNGKGTREVSWFCFLNHLKGRVTEDDERGEQDLICVTKHWTTIQKRLRSRGIHFPRQLILDAKAQEAQWLLPEQMKNNPGWLKPLRRLVLRADPGALFHTLDRGMGAPDPPAHLALVSELLHMDDRERKQRPLVDIFRDERWSQVRSSALMASWLKFLERNNIRTAAPTGMGKSKAIVAMLQEIGINEACYSQRLRAICLWLAPSLSTVEPNVAAEELNSIFSAYEPLSREHVDLQTYVGEEEKVVREVGSYRVLTGKGVVRVEEENGRHIGTVNQGRWHRLAEIYTETELIRVLPGWIAQVEEEERTRGVPSHQLWQGIKQAFQADTIKGCNPLVAPPCFAVALREGAEEGWGHREKQTRVVYNFLTMSAAEIKLTVARLRQNEAWLALTRAKTLERETEAQLQLVGAKVHVWPAGTVAAAGNGNWRKAQIRSVATKEAWTLWTNADTAAPQLRLTMRTVRLTRDGAVPLDPDCPSFKEAQLGPGGAGFNNNGTIIATDGAVKEDGRMGAAYVALGNKIPPRAFIVLGPPSSMRAELSGLDQALADGPNEELTLLTDSLSSILKLMSMQRKDFPEWLHSHPERALLECVVQRINARVRAGLITRIIKVTAHAAHPLNEAADAAASAAAEEADSESVMMSHVDRGAVQFYLNGTVTEWGAGVRRHLVDIVAQQHAAQLSLALTRQTDTDNDNNDRREHVSLTARWLLRPEQGRMQLGSVMAGMRNGAQKRRLMQSIAGVFPCRALLNKWGKAQSPTCLLCNGDAETIAHIQCWCPALKEARIRAHHSVAGVIFERLRRHPLNWQIHTETPVSSLRAIDTPLDLYDTWNRMVDALEETDSEDNMEDAEHPQVMGRLRPDGYIGLQIHVLSGERLICRKDAVQLFCCHVWLYCGQ